MEYKEILHKHPLQAWCFWDLDGYETIEFDFSTCYIEGVLVEIYCDSEDVEGVFRYVIMNSNEQKKIVIPARGSIFINVSIA